MKTTRRLDVLAAVGVILGLMFIIALRYYNPKIVGT